MLAIYKKELRSALFGMTGPIFMVAVLAIFGYFCFRYQFTLAAPQIEYTVADSAFWCFLLAPLLTMRSFSEERRTKTDQLLYSLPITTTQVVLGKYFALVTILAIPCAVICTYPLIVSQFAATGMNLALAYGSILAFFLLGCAVIAIGIFISSLFDNIVITAIINFLLFFALYLCTPLAGDIPTTPVSALVALIVLSVAIGTLVYYITKSLVAGIASGAALVAASVIVYFVKSSLYEGLLAKAVSVLFIFRPVTAFASSVFDITAFVYYLSAAALFVFFTVLSFEKRRWN